MRAGVSPICRKVTSFSLESEARQDVEDAHVGSGAEAGDRDALAFEIFAGS